MNYTGVAPTGDINQGAAYVDAQGHVHFTTQADAQDQAGFNSWSSKLGRISPYIVGGIMTAGQLGPLLAGGEAAAGGAPTAAGASTGAGASTAAGVPAMPWTIPAGFESSMGAAPIATGGGVSFLSQLGNQFKNDPLGSIGKIGSVLGGAGQGAAEGRRADAGPMAQTQQVNLNTTKLNDQRALLASLLGGVQDASIGRPEGSTIPTFNISGGLRPSALSNKEALIRQLTTQVAPLELPKAGIGEKILGGGGLIGGILGQLGNIARPSASVYRTPPYAG